jgi:hypothetical protein
MDEPLVLLEYSWCHVTDIGLVFFGEEPDWDTFRVDVGAMLVMDDALRWAIADAYRLGTGWFNGQKDPAQAIDWAKVSIKTVQNWAWVAGCYEYLERVRGASIHHHSVVAKLPNQRRRYWLTRVAIEDWSVEMLAEATAEERGAIGYGRDDYETMFDYYNRILEIYQRMPNYPEKPMVRRALKILESALQQVRSRIKLVKDAA